MIGRLTVGWPAEVPLPAGIRLPVRLLAVSDERDAALDHDRNRAEIGVIDGVVACGDLEPDYLAFLADAFCVPLLYVRGNHDRGAGWSDGSGMVPRPLEEVGQRMAGIEVSGLSWPGETQGNARRDEGEAWRQSIGLYLRTFFGRRRPHIILSHVPPRGLGDADADPYHTGFNGYRWLLRSLRPVLWLHGHTTLASVAQRWTRHQSTTLVNVTGGMLIQIDPRAPA